jgi:ribosome-associated protein
VIVINDELSIPESELTFTASRSGGPGGQNVNKVSSRVTLTFDVEQSPSLSDEQRRRISERLKSRINKDGVLRVVSQRTRSQDLNREDAVALFAELLRRALIVEKKRVKTRVPKAAHDRRLEEKKKRTVVKAERRRKDWD